MGKDKLTILFVDDDPDFSGAMSLWFKNKGYDTLVAPDGEQGIRRIKENSPDIVFLDLRMPGMGGIDTLKEIRSFNQDIPVIVISAHADEDRIAEAQALKASGVFHKGNDFTEGLSLIETALRTHEKLK